MARTGIRRIKGEEYPFGEVEQQDDAAFSDLFDDRVVAEAALQREAARVAEEERKLKSTGLQSYPSPQETLDLHGFTAVEAEGKTQRFIEEVRGRGIRTVRVITGKGLHSPGGKAVLPDVVEQNLSIMKKEGTITSFQWDKKVKERSGALLVYL